MIDKSIPHVAVLLVHKNSTEYPRYELPEAIASSLSGPAGKKIGCASRWIRS